MRKQKSMAFSHLTFCIFNCIFLFLLLTALVTILLLILQHVCVLVTQSCPILCNSMDRSSPGSSVHGILQIRTAAVGSHFLLQGIFLTQGSNPGLPYCRQILYGLSHQGSTYNSKQNVTEHLCDRHCFTCIISFNPHNYEVDLNIRSHFQMRNLKLKKIKKLTHLYMVSIQT